MSQYPTDASERRFAYTALLEHVTGIFMHAGMSVPDANLLATSLAQADLHGIHSHGVMRVLDYVGRMSCAADVDDLPGVRGGVDPRGQPRIDRDAGAMVSIDGGNSMGQLGMSLATRTAIERARDTGISFVTVGNSNHCGALFWYVQQIVEADMIGIASTNALPTMAPAGGADRIVGMNPLGIGIPTANESPFLMDSAFAACARGKIQVYAQKGMALPEGWAFDAHGAPTTDPHAALDGLIAPVGTYKGINVAMALGVMSSLMSGAGYGTRLGDLPTGPLAGKDGHFVIALDIGKLTDVDAFKAEMDAIIAEIHNAPRAAGVDRLYCAGEMELETACAYGRDGIPLNDETFASLCAAASRVGAPSLQ